MFDFRQIGLDCQNIPFQILNTGGSFGANFWLLVFSHGAMYVSVYLMK